MAINQNEYIHAMAEDPETGKPMQKVKVEGLESNSMTATEIQSRYSTSVQTHSGVTIAPSTWSTASTWIDCSTFYDVGINLTNSLAQDTAIDIVWSHNGTTISGREADVKPGLLLEKAFLTQTKAPYIRVDVFNKHTAPVTINTWVYLKS